jgi:putative NADH-flavin reductase
MRIAILGAAGQTGRALIAEALRRGHEVIALARDPDRVESRDPRVTRRRADAFDRASVVAGLAGADAVVTTVGKLDLRDKRVNLSTAAHAAVVEGMAAHGVGRLVAISSLGAAKGVNRKGIRRNLYLWFRRRYYGDMHEMEKQVLAARGAGATVVRAPMLDNGPAEGRFELVTDPLRLPRGLHVSRADLARFILDELERPVHPGAIVALANPPR